jgi:lipid A 3-O-deacylase
MLLTSGMALAADDRPATFVSLQLENDFFANSGDRYYTHGSQLPLLQNTDPPALLDKISDLVPFYRKGEQLSLVNFTVAQNIFTPDNTEATTVVQGDRPYAGYLYFGAAVLSRINSSELVDYGNMFEVTVGAVGPSALGKEIQTGYHDLLGIDSPQGWDNQLHDEPALGLSYTRFWRLVTPVSDTLQLGVAPHTGMALGNVYTYGAGGVLFRFGKDLRRDLSPPNIRPGFPGLAYFEGGDEPSWYFYLGMEGRLVARDIFLDGNTFRSSHSVDKEPLVGEMQFGFVYLWRDMRIAFSNMLRTAEFKGQQDNMHYGAVNFSFVMR